MGLVFGLRGLQMVECIFQSGDPFRVKVEIEKKKPVASFPGGEQGGFDKRGLALSERDDSQLFRLQFGQLVQLVYYLLSSLHD